MDSTSSDAEHANALCPDGHVNPAGQHFCGECGKPVAVSAHGNLGIEPTDHFAKASGLTRIARPIVLVPLAVVVVAAVAGIFLLTRDSSPESHSITGLLTLTDTDEFWTEGDACEGSGGYGDIREGAQVTVKDGNGTTLATSNLLEGVASNAFDCDFAFALPDVPEAEFYAVEVSHRGEITSSRRELEDNNWFVGLSLGD